MAGSRTSSPGSFRSAGSTRSAAGGHPVTDKEVLHQPEIDLDVLDLLPSFRERVADILVSAALNITLSLAKFGGPTRCLARFLRARNCDLAEAETMLRETFAWRLDESVNECLDDVESKRVWTKVRPFWPGIYVGMTDTGNPVTYFKVIHLVELYEKIPEEDLRSFYVSWMEKILAMQHDGYRKAGCESCIPGCIEIYDCEGCGLWTCTYVRGLAVVSSVLGIGQQHYPENLNKAWVINIPGAFELAWNVVSVVLSERTMQKISIHSDNALTELVDARFLSFNRLDWMLNCISPPSDDDPQAPLLFSCTGSDVNVDFLLGD